nr:ImmA/IrrE family metallo-endopeptidase [Pseudobythopirellula maris]
MYCREPRTAIVLPSTRHRPPGRVAFTCAHELGHHELGHGTRVDEYLAGGTTDQRRSPEEVAADVFAAHLLMPRQAILAAAKAYHLDIKSITPEQTFLIAGLFSVGYSALLGQLTFGLQLLPRGRFDGLKRHQPKSIRSVLYPPSAKSGLVVFHDDYPSATVDMEVGDFVLAQEAFADEPALLTSHPRHDEQTVWEAACVGQERLKLANGREVAIRVSRRGYVGAWRYRFLPEEE